MQNVKIFLPDNEKVQKFVATLTGFDGDFELISGNYILDAKSLMGIFTFDLSKPVNLKVYNDTPEIMQAIAPYIVE